MRLLHNLCFGLLLACAACRHMTDLSPIDCTFDHTSPAYNLDTLYTPIQPCGTATYYLNPDRYAYYDACFNPNNNNQIAFIRHDLSTFPWTIELCTFDFCTGLLKVITDRGFEGPDWSVQDWITFRGKNKEVWKIKSNGDSLTQMTFTGSNHVSPQWDNSGNRLLFYETFPDYPRYVITNTAGVRLDTIESLGTSEVAWDGTNILTANTSNQADINHIYLRDLSGNILEEVQSIEIPPLGSYDSMIVSIDLWTPEQLIYWTFARQINVTDFNGHRHAIAKTVNNNWYGRVSVSGDGTKLLVERTDRRRTDLCIIEEHNRLYLMESDGSNERRIVFPE